MQWFGKLPGRLFAGVPPSSVQNVEFGTAGANYDRSYDPWTITWEAPADDGGVPLEGYYIYVWSEDDGFRSTSTDPTFAN